jgi:hypothetical protein
VPSYHFSVHLLAALKIFTDSCGTSQLWLKYPGNLRKIRRTAQRRSAHNDGRENIRARKVNQLSAKNAIQKCILVIVDEGFDKPETVTTISILRQARLVSKVWD